MQRDNPKIVLRMNGNKKVVLMKVLPVEGLVNVAGLGVWKEESHYQGKFIA